jgi:hypothetical protein
MGYSKKMDSGWKLKTVFTILAVIPLLVFLLWLNVGFPRSIATSELLGVPGSILALLGLMFFQVVLTWSYLRFFEERGGAKS